MNKPKRKIDRLSHDMKMIVCDNCEKSDICEDAYAGFFKDTACQRAYKSMKDYMDDEEVED